MMKARAFRARTCALLTLLSVSACGGEGGSADSQDAQAAKSSKDAGAAKPPKPSCDVLGLFATDGLAGAAGCTGAICHTAGVMTLDLESEGLERRLLDEPANPEGPCKGEILVDSDKPDDSLLFKKVSGKSKCGSPMPLTNPSALTKDQVRCIQEYVEFVAADGKR